ncbi:MAG: DNA polymerase III subunit gamma/tau [Erysipelotrichaceae bacterium]|nr:DNA polymerase III subunit gamma/tau [Erysipelotrichaceae bacterium]
MAYKALYRTYRPNSFEEVVGQKYIVTTLRNAIAQNKTAHAYLFCGPRGTGKTTVAKLLAKAVNCTGEHAPCNHCESCRMIQEGTHPDVVEIDAASNNGVDEIRSLIEKVKYAPIESKYKVYIIDEVHMLTPGAFNALLKTLEEPPSHIIFVLATTEVQKVIPTIISRCQRFDFGRVSIPDISYRLEEVMKIEGIRYEPGIVPLISDLAEGGMRDALSILDQVIAYAQNDLKVTHVNEIYGITTPTEKFELLNDVLIGETQELLELSGHIVDNGMDIKRLTNDLIEILKECVIYEYTKRDGSLLTKIDAEKAEALLAKRDANGLLAMIDVLIDTMEKYRFASDINSYFEVALLKMMDLNRRLETADVQPETAAVKIKKKSKATDTEPQMPITETVPEPAPENVPDVDYEKLLELLVSADKQKRFVIEGLWDQLANYHKDINYARYVSRLCNCAVKASGNGFVLVATKYAAEAELVNQENGEPLLSELILKIFGEDLRITAVTESEFKKLVELFMERQAANTLPVIDKKTAESKPDLTHTAAVPDDVDQKLTALFGEGMFDVVD